MLKTTLDQWVVFKTIIDTKGFCAAAEELNRSQSAISYSMAKLQSQLNVQLIKIDGRRCELTASGEQLLQMVRPLLDDFVYLEKNASHLSHGIEANILINIDNIFPKEILFKAIAAFNEKYPLTGIDIDERLRLLPSDDLDFDLAITTSENGLIPGKKIVDVSLIPVAHFEHPIFQLDFASLTHEKLSCYKQIFYQRKADLESKDISLDPRKHWSVHSIDAAIAAVKANLCLGWLPEHAILDSLKLGELKKIITVETDECYIPLYLLENSKKPKGPAVSYLAEMLHRVAHEYTKAIKNTD